MNAYVIAGVITVVALPVLGAVAFTRGLYEMAERADQINDYELSPQSERVREGSDARKDDQ